MTYSVKEIFYSLQGEGTHAGRPAVFCRFAGCNLWSGRERDRASAVCRFCDTDFLGGTRYETAAALADAIVAHWPSDSRAFVVCTGGEPALQLDRDLLAALHARWCYVAIETNGTLPLPAGVDWITVSPKENAATVVRAGDELKVVWPQAFDLDELERWNFGRYYLQPMAGAPDSAQICVETCLARPAWRLSLQTHKLLGLR